MSTFWLADGTLTKLTQTVCLFQVTFAAVALA